MNPHTKGRHCELSVAARTVENMQSMCKLSNAETKHFLDHEVVLDHADHAAAARTTNMRWRDE